MPPAAYDVVGRDEELAAVTSFLDGGGLPAALVLEGEPGIGKTTLWRRGVELARERDFGVLSCAPAETESTLPFAALGDLLADVVTDVPPDLPEPQRAALEIALQRSSGDEGSDRLATARATLELLRRCAGRTRVLVAIDDAQWLDGPTTAALEFAVRRLGDSPVHLLLARRAGHALPLDLERALADGGLQTLSIGPLRASDLDRVIRLRLGLELPRPTLLHIERITDGNPLYALQVARTFDPVERTVVVPATLADALASRISQAPPDVRQTLLHAALCLQPTISLLERAAGGPEGLRATLDVGLLEVTGRRVRFAHPLLASVTLDQSLPGEKRAAHLRLAEVADDPAERALHLARGSEGPDESLATELESAARLAAARAGPEIAAELAEAAARLTPTAGPSARRRLGDAAEYHVAAGDPARGRELLEQAVAGLDRGPERAAFLWRLADTIGDSIEESIRLCEQALDEADGDPSLTAEIHTALGVFTWIAGDLEGSTEHCRQAVRFSELAGDDERLAIAIGEMCHAETLLGLPWDRDAMERALEIERRLESFPPSLRPSFQLAVISLVTDELDTARPLLEAELERARRAGDEPATFHALFRVAELELRAGRWADALRAAREGVELTRQGGIEQEQAVTEMTLALVLAHLGQQEEATRLAERAHRLADAVGDRAIAIRSAGVLGFVSLSAGDPERALEWLTPAREELSRMGTGELSVSGVVQNEIEALVAVGSLDAADSVIAFVDEKARRSGRAWHRAVASRGRALVAAARGDVASARAAVEAALRAHERLPQPFELARTLLAAGLVERRDRHWAAARGHLTAALELFDDLGAAAWAERSASELARLPGRRPHSGELTETERQIAELVAQGLSNKEVAAKLFVTVRTVEANLTKVYAKLGIRSRTELARALAR
jgi:DNA-binding CsgD family transcriptional regulator